VSGFNPSNTSEDDSTQPRLTKRGARTRQRLLDAAEEIFGKKGYYNASIVDICQAAEVAQGTFYLYFSSKYEIFAELITQLSRDFRRRIREEVARAKSQAEAQQIGFRTFFEWVKNHRNLYSIVQQSVLVDENLYRAYYERLASGYVKGLSQAMEDGEFRPLDPETVAYCLMGISQFIGMRWVYWEGGDVPEKVMNDTFSFIFDGLKAKEKENVGHEERS